MSLVFGRDAAIAQRSRKDVQAAVGFGRMKAEHMGDPWIEIHVFKRRDGFSDTRSGPAAKKLAFISGMLCGSKPCMPTVGG